MGGSKISPSTHTPSSAGTLPPAPPGADACPLLSRFKEAIRRIKEQKQRPGFDRMLQTLKTHHEVHDAKEVRRQLELAVSTGLLLTVYTKGLQCYKDPDSLLGLRRFKIDTVNTRSRVQRAVKAAVREIGDPEGSSPEEIENYVRLSFTVSIPLAVPIRQALEYLVCKGTLVQPSPKRYRFCSLFTAGKTSNDSKDLTTSSDTNEPASPPPPPAPAPPSPTTSTPAPIKRKRGRPKRVILSVSGSAEVPPPPPVAKCVIPSAVSTATASIELPAPPVSMPAPAADAPLVKRPGLRKYKAYQCWACDFFTPKKLALLKHVKSVEHREKVAGKMVQCNTCNFRTKVLEKMTAHLQRHNCHEGRSIPSCLLSCSNFHNVVVK